MTKHRILWSGAAALATGATITAVVALSTVSAAPGPQSTTEGPWQQAADQLPLERYRMTVEEMNLLAEARYNLVQRCLSRFDLEGLGELAVDTGTRFHTAPVLTEGTARRHGYHPATVTPQPRMKLPKPRMPLTRRNVTDAKNVMTGRHLVRPGKVEPLKTFRGRPVPKRGCHGQVLRVFGEQLPIDPEVLAMQADTKARSSKPMREATTKWAACMAAADISKYKSPFAAMGDPRWGLQSKHGQPPVGVDPSGPDEVETAITDARCRTRTGYTDTLLAEQSKAQRAIIGKNRQQLEQAGKIIQKRMTEAKKHTGN